VGDLRLSLEGASSAEEGASFRLILTDLNSSSVLDLEGRGRPEVDGVEEEDVAINELSWEVKAREPESAISFFCFLGGGCP